MKFIPIVILLSVISVAAYPRPDVELGKRLYLERPLTLEEFRVKAQREGTDTVEPIAQYVEKISVICAKDIETLCKGNPYNDSLFGNALCLTRRTKKLSSDCAPLFSVSNET